MRKHMIYLMILAILATMLPLSAVAVETVASGTCGDSLSWTLDTDGLLTITGTGSMGTDIPWQAYRRQLRSVAIAPGVTSISDYAFARTGITAVSIPTSVTAIGAGAFYATGLTEVTISEAVTDIGYAAFSNCLSLKRIDVDDANPAYHSVDGLLYRGDTLIRVPAGVTAVTFAQLPEIAVDAFRGATATVTAPEAVSGNYGGQLTWETVATPIPSLTAQSCTAAFEGAIQLNIYFAAQNVENAVEIGLLTFDSYPSVGTINQAVNVIPDAVINGQSYMASTPGIPAKNLGDTVYFCAYARMADGSYVYSTVNGYSPQAYAESLLNRTDSAVVALAKSMLDYGAAAQQYFAYRTDTLMNACLEADAHQYDQTWIAERPATLTLGGTEYRKCTLCGGKKQTRLTDKLTVDSIAVTTLPDRMSYHNGEEFDPTGMVVTATLSDGSTLPVYDYQAAMSNGTVSVTCEGASTQFDVTLLEPALVSVSEAFAAANGSMIYVEGLYVGVAEEGASSDKEVLLKDLNSDEIIALRNVPYGSFPEYGYEYGDRIRVLATIELDGTSNTPNKRYLDFSVENGTIASTLVSVGNEVTYDLTDRVKVESWEQLQALFTVGAIDEYTFVEITGPIYFNRYDGSDGVSVSRIHTNSAATGVSGIRTDGKRTVSLRDNVMERNLGADWMSLFFSQTPVTGSYPGYALTGSMVALYTGANGYYYQLTVLDESWISLRDYDEYDVVTEVAYAYHRQGTQIQYDQTQSRRNINAAPEEASASNTLYMDCSSYVNAVYYEAFGVNVMPYTLTEKRPSTAAFTTYAQENVGTAVDAIGYWENADYTTADQISGIVSEVRGQLQVGDLLVYRHGETSGSSGHVYIYVGEDTFLHCTGASYVYGDTPAASYDKATTDESTIGAVQTIAADDIFVDTANKRYLFKVSAADTVYNFSLLRPMARGLTATEESKKRMKIRGIDMEKQVSDVSASVGQTVTYTVTLTDHDSISRTVRLEELLGTNVSYASGPVDMRCIGQTLSWTGTVDAGATVTVSYDITVDSGTLVESRTTLSGVALDDLITTVSCFDAAQLGQVTALAKQYAAQGKTFADPIDMAQSLYQEALGESRFVDTTAMAVLDGIIDTTNDTCYANDMLVPNLYGGLDIKSGFVYDNQRTRLVLRKNLAAGDVIVAEYGGISDVFVYLGDGALVQVNSTDGVCREVTSSGNIYASDDILVTLIAYDRFAVLRPSMAR